MKSPEVVDAEFTSGKRYKNANYGVLDLVGPNRDVSARVSQSDQDCCLKEGMECISKYSGRVTDSDKAKRLEGVVTFFQRQQDSLILLQCDKGRGFVVLPKSMFNDQQRAAVRKNFAAIKVSAARVKSRFIDFCKGLNLVALAEKSRKVRKAV